MLTMLGHLKLCFTETKAYLFSPTFSQYTCFSFTLQNSFQNRNGFHYHFVPFTKTKLTWEDFKSSISSFSIKRAQAVYFLNCKITKPNTFSPLFPVTVSKQAAIHFQPVPFRHNIEKSPLKELLSSSLWTTEELSLVISIGNHSLNPLLHMPVHIFWRQLYFGRKNELLL